MNWVQAIFNIECGFVANALFHAALSWFSSKFGCRRRL